MGKDLKNNRFSTGNTGHLSTRPPSEGQCFKLLPRVVDKRLKISGVDLVHYKWLAGCITATETKGRAGYITYF